MKMKLISLAVLAFVTAAAQAQNGSTEQLQQALAQAQKAAADAQKAADQAMKALADIQQANTEASRKPATAAQPGGESAKPAAEGLVLGSSDDYVRLYGLIDLSVSNHNNADKSGASLTDMSVAWFSGNRWGLEGAHALKTADDLKVIFLLESEYELPTGNMDTPGVLFNRDAWMGLESKSLGKLTFGRQNTLAREFSKIYGDPYGSSAMNLTEGGYTNNNNFKQLIFYSGSATGTRYDKGVVWKKEYDKFVVGLGYQFGGIPGDFSEGSTKSVGLAYNGGVANVSAFYNTANVAGLTNSTYSFGGNYKVGIVRLNAGYFHYKADQPTAIGERKDNAYTLSAKIAPKGTFDYEVGYQVMDADNAAVNGSGYVLNAYANASNAKATASGKRKTLYGSIFYHFDKRTDLYIAADRLNTDGTYLAGQANGFRSQTGAAAGMRFRF
ncbi:porin [Duganella sp. Dugasp56]|uniref:porin n=1 Tax=Duganella sp. Dugasp56 TaxID=3243046 RepID=UPI0039AEE290